MTRDKQDPTRGGHTEGPVASIVCDRFADGEWARVSALVPSEVGLAIYVNQQELVTIVCTPTKLNYLVLGFLYAEGIISGTDDVLMMRLYEKESLADVRLRDRDYKPPGRRILTSGCWGGATFKTQAERIDTELEVEPTAILALMKKFQEHMELYRLSGGVHTSALADARDIVIVAEDIGRRNTLDKIQGECLARGVSTRDRLLLTTGRASSEMLLKAARMQTPVIISRHSPTASAVSLARDLGITLVGHARGGRLIVYSHPERLGRSVGEV